MSHDSKLPYQSISKSSDDSYRPKKTESKSAERGKSFFANRGRGKGRRTSSNSKTHVSAKLAGLGPNYPFCPPDVNPHLQTLSDKESVLHKPMLHTNPYEEVASLQRVIVQQKMIIHNQEERLTQQEKRLSKQEATIIKLTKMMQKEVTSTTTQPDEELHQQIAALNIILIKIMISGKQYIYHALIDIGFIDIGSSITSINANLIPTQQRKKIKPRSIVFGKNTAE